ncbi:hypothetical protein HNO80_06110 [Arthrobacter sp. C9C5]|nr:hypothetical protein [Arthrobacter sp. C9C5]
MTINVLPNSTAANKTTKRLLRPSYKIGKGATLVSTRLAVRTAAGKVITPSATSVNVLPGSYRVTTTIRYTYKQNGKTVAKTVSKAQNLVIGVVKPAPVKSVDADVFNRLNALRVNKGLPAFKASPAFEAFLTAEASGVRNVPWPTGADRLSTGGAVGGSYVGIAKIVVDLLLDQSWLRADLYDPDYNTLSVVTRTTKGEKYVFVSFARIAAPGPAPVPVPVSTVKPSPLTAADVFSRLNALRLKKGLSALPSVPAFNTYVAAGGSSIDPMEWPTRMRSSTTTGVEGSSAGSAASVVSQLLDRGFPQLYDPSYNVLSVTVSSVNGENKIYVGLGRFTDPV